MESELNLLKKCRLYHKYFKDIKGIRFTEREIDIIICIFYEKADKKIASILGMSHRTVSTHIHNISNKIGYSTKDQIICFVQKQQPAPIIHLCYAILQTDYHLSLALSKINQLQKLYLASNNSFEGGFDLTKKTYIKNYSFEDKESNKIFKNHLKILGIDVANSNSGKEDLNHIEIHQDKIIKGSYFQFIFQFIRKIIPESLLLEIDKIEEGFFNDIKQYKEIFKTLQAYKSDHKTSCNDNKSNNFFSCCEEEMLFDYGQSGQLLNQNKLPPPQDHYQVHNPNHNYSHYRIFLRKKLLTKSVIFSFIALLAFLSAGFDLFDKFIDKKIESNFISINSKNYLKRLETHDDLDPLISSEKKE